MIGIITFMAAAEAADKSNKALKEIQQQILQLPQRQFMKVELVPTWH